jgi:hypothetical protein
LQLCVNILASQALHHADFKHLFLIFTNCSRLQLTVSGLNVPYLVWGRDRFPLFSHGPVAELADAADFKSETVQGVWVRIPPGPPQKEDAMAKAPNLRDMKSRLDVIEREIEKLTAQKEIILEMMGAQPDEPQKRAKKGSVKNAVIDLLESAGERGLSASQAITRGKERGMELDRGSVSSLLSRLKSDGVVSYDGERYRLKKYAASTHGGGPTIMPIRTSGGSVSG